jgi:hypothetical protein
VEGAARRDLEAGEVDVAGREPLAVGAREVRADDADEADAGEQRRRDRK